MKNLRQRDSQRSKLYDAERRAGMCDNERIEDVIDIGYWVNFILRSDKVRSTYPHLKWWSTIQESGVRVLDGRGCRRARAWADRIKMPKWSRTRGIILHELAHVIHRRNIDWAGEAGHGWRYASIYLNLTLWFLGKQQYRRLKEAFRDGGVRFREKAKRAASPAQPKGVLPEGLRKYMERKRKENTK